MKHIKDKILENTFVDRIRGEMVFDDYQYKELVNSLTELSGYLRNQTSIDKNVALVLYHIPQIVRNVFLGFDDTENSEIRKTLEDAWVELDALVLDCLAG